jgi:uncharacterized repeat protein (TIGR04076 family)
VNGSTLPIRSLNEHGRPSAADVVVGRADADIEVATVAAPHTTIAVAARSAALRLVGTPNPLVRRRRLLAQTGSTFSQTVGGCKTGDGVSSTGVTEMTLYDLRVTVERIEGRSVCGLEVGDYFELTESSRVRIPEGRHFCLYALQSVLPLLPAKQRKLPDEDWLEQDSLACCPDPDERVVMRIERTRERTLRTEQLT